MIEIEIRKGVFMKRQKVEEIIDILDDMYPDAKCELNYNSTFHLLVATMLSAQSTDKVVNKVTKKLFEKYKEPSDFLKLTAHELEEEIKEIGLYKNKAKNILKTCEKIVFSFNGIVPKSIERLVLLPGVGRKTANVVLSNAFGIPAIAVDTHVFRVSNRIGLVNGKTAQDVEKQLMEMIPEHRWSKTHHVLIWHGRRICYARSPKCGDCRLKNRCEYFVKLT